MLSFRTAMLTVCAVGGAVLSVVSMPVLLDSIFETIKKSSFNSLTGGTLEFQNHAFKKVVFGPTKTTTAPAELKTALARLQEQSVKLDTLCQQENVHCTDVDLSSTTLSQRRDLKPLLGLTRPGQIAEAADESEPSGPALYVLKGIVNTQRQGTVDEGQSGYPGSRSPLLIIALAILGATIGLGLGNIGFRLSEKGAAEWIKMETGDRVNLFLGVVTGIIVSLPFLVALQSLGTAVAWLMTLGLTVGFSAVAIYALNTVADVLPWKRGELRGRKSGIKILDTNVLIDGRIYDLARTGFLDGDIYVPKFVLMELQHIADSPDALRRQRGRRGLDVLRLMQANFNVEVGDQDRLAGDTKDEVDTRLVKLAMALGADLVSNDYNLNKVASIQDVRVLNINDLALALKPNVLPGESLELMILREGSQQGQGVGYLEDGTMVVVENASDALGSTIDVIVTQVIQTERGKMIFGNNGEGGDQARTVYNRK